MANGSGSSFNNPYDTQNGGILSTPYPSATGGNTYLYEESGNGNNLNHSNSIIPFGGGTRERSTSRGGTRERSTSRGGTRERGKNRKRGKYTKGRKIPKYISSKKGKNKITKKKCQVCNFKIF